MVNSVDPDQLASLRSKLTDLDLYGLQMQGISGFSRTKVKSKDHFCLMQSILILHNMVRNRQFQY